MSTDWDLATGICAPESIFIFFSSLIFSYIDVCKIQISLLRLVHFTHITPIKKEIVISLIHKIQFLIKSIMHKHHWASALGSNEAEIRRQQYRRKEEKRKCLSSEIR